MPNKEHSAGEPPNRDVTVESPGVVLVSGANKGIGVECVRRLIDAGFRVYLGARNPDLGRPAAASLGAQFVELDITCDESVQQVATQIAVAEGRLDLLVNNAGISGPLGEAKDYTAADAENVLMTNVVGCVRMMHTFLPLLEQSAEPASSTSAAASARSDCFTTQPGSSPASARPCTGRPKQRSTC